MADAGEPGKVYSNVSALALWLKRRPKDGNVIFVVDEGSRPQAVQAYAIGATDLLTRPINRKTLLTKLLGDIESLAGGPLAFSMGSSRGVLNGVRALQNILVSASLGAPIESKMIDAAGESIIAQVEDEGFVSWIDIVRKHHSQTYQHCLIVTGVAVTFAQNLGSSNADQLRVATARLLHDIGKARIPLAILEKPGPLDQDELAT